MAKQTRIQGLRLLAYSAARSLAIESKTPQEEDFWFSIFTLIESRYTVHETPEIYAAAQREWLRMLGRNCPEAAFSTPSPLRKQT